MVLRSLHISDHDTCATFDVALFDGVEPAALTHAVAARAGIDAREFFLTATADRAGAIVPLSSALPNGMRLVLHRSCPAGRSDGVSSPPPSPPDASAMPGCQETNGSTTAPLLSGSGPSGFPINAPPPASGGAPPARSRLAGITGGFSHTRTMENQLEGIERLNRLTTDLANERTLLAWTRTCLAAIRTLFTYLAIDATSIEWKNSVRATEISMATLVIVTAGTGAWRYFKVKAAVFAKIPPRGFGRHTIRPLVVLIFLTALSTAIGVYSGKWIHMSSAHPDP